jgi:hypothetical protein
MQDQSKSSFFLGPDGPSLMGCVGWGEFKQVISQGSCSSKLYSDLLVLLYTSLQGTAVQFRTLRGS